MICQVCNTIGSCAMGYIQVGEDWLNRIHANADCKECGVSQGDLHHGDCPNETCPVCKGKLARCECFPATIMLGAA